MWVPVVLLLVNAVLCEVREPYSVDYRSAFDQDLYENVLDEEQCSLQLQYLSDNNDMLLRFFDSSAKLPAGLLSGNLNDLGDYYQCLDIDEYVDDLNIQGKYSVVTIPLDQEIDIPSLIDLLPPITVPPWPTWPTFPSITDIIPGIVDSLFPTGIPWPTRPDVTLPTYPTLPDFSNVTWPEINITRPTLPDFTWPPNVTFPDLSEVTLPDLSNFTLPDLSNFTLPDLSNFTLPNLSNFTLPNLSNVTLPDLSNYTLPGGITLPDLSDVSIPDLSELTRPDLSEVTLPPGFTIPNLSDITLPEGITLPPGWTIPEGITLPPGWTLPEGITLPPGWTRLEGITWPWGNDNSNTESDVESDSDSDEIQRYRHDEIRKAKIEQRRLILQKYQALRHSTLGISGFGRPIESRIFPVTLMLNLGSTLGVCIPKVCTTREVYEHFQLNVLNITYNDFFYRLPNDKRFAPVDYVAIALLSFIGLCVIVSTSYDLHHIFVLKRDPSKANTLYRSFSVYTNTRRFLTFNSPPGSLECVDGIRAISMMWVVVGHTYSFTLLGYIHNITEAIMFLTKASTTWVNSAPLTVDTFFMLSGLLAVYTTIGKISKGRFIRTVHLFYINRLLRMFPLLATVVLLQASLFNHMSDGPFWLNVSLQAENCRKYWWAILLHVQNYVNPLEICIPQSWYLSVDVQLYFFCPLILIFLFGREFISWIALGVIMAVALAASTTYAFVYNFSAGVANPGRLDEFDDYMTTYYINTLPRAAPFFVGMIYGYLLYLCKGKRVKISKINVALLWILSFAMLAFGIFSMYPVMQIEHDAQLFDNFLNAYIRSIWACALGWIIFACVHGYGGPINWFLSLQMWKLPARLSFAMYLVHVSIIMIANGSWLKTHYFTEGDNIYRYMSDLMITFIASFILCITIDAPFSTLQKLLLGGGGKKPRRPENGKPESQLNIVIDAEPQIMKTNL